MNDNHNSTRPRAGLDDALIGARVMEARILIGRSRKWLADALGLTYQQIQKYETGENRISAYRLFEIAIILDKPVSFFYITVAQKSGALDVLKSSYKAAVS